LALPFGVGHMPWQEAGNYDPFEVTKIQKTNEVEPRYILTINRTRELTVSCKEILNFNLLSEVAFRDLDLIVMPRKTDQWRADLHELKKGMELVAGDLETSRDQTIINATEQFASKYHEARGKEDILKHMIPVLDETTNEVLFKIEDLLHWLNTHKRMQLTEPLLARVLRLRGFKSTRRTICGKKLRTWSVPLSNLNLQTEDFPQEDLTGTGGKEL
jgi:hypothetical protein